MTRSPAPDRPPPPLAGLLVTGALLALGVLCVALRVPAADAVLDGFCAADWHPPAGYPPFAAILFTPAAWLPAGVLKAVLVLGSGGLLALLVLLSCRLAGVRARPGPVLAATIAGLWLEPLFQSPLPGQIDLALACLALWDLGRPRAALGKGFALGTAAGITLTPAVCVPYLLVTGRVRAGLTALAGFTGTALLGALVLPEASAAFWADPPPAAGGVPLLHWQHLWVWAVPPLTALTARTAAALRRHRHRRHRHATAATAAARLPAPGGAPGGASTAAPGGPAEFTAKVAAKVASTAAPENADETVPEVAPGAGGPVGRRAGQSPASSSSASMIR
ncbi:glycosyltransferase 87 family protein [Streptomyces sp. NPDC001546]|uniref:glycosyltransferase 87 family protein n=1 Tax=Streptomyces sp. NPDC001546 TaxID=3364585 RepID=UPI0036C10259